MKKTLVFLFSIVLTSLTFFSCSNPGTTSTYIGNWTAIGNILGPPRTAPVCFTIGDTAYIGLGYNPTYIRGKFPRDFYKYTLNTNSFSKIDSFPGAGRYYAVAFTVNNKGYVGTGFENENNTYFNDFYEYDPAAVITTTNLSHWRQVASMGTYNTGARRGAVAFGIKSNGYVGTGYNDNTDGYLSDFWKFTPDAGQGTWTETTGLLNKRAYGASFVIQDKGYVVTGENNGTPTDIFYRFDATTQLWTEMRRISNFNKDESYDDNYNIRRYWATGFASSTKGYVTCGYSGGNRSDTWEYDYVKDLWIQKTSFEGSARKEAIGFSLSDRLFVGAGVSGSYYFDDIWEFKPFQEYDATY